MDKSEVSLTSEDALVSENSDVGNANAEDDKLQRVMSGLLQNLPPLSSKIVRIFTSSTFTDTTVERNALMENVYPKLKQYLREKHGLEFQVVDMRWGVRDEATDDHMTTHLCMQEIQNCQRLSLGPNFIVFLGQKYGYRPIPTCINSAEFQYIKEVAKGVESELELLEQWYKADDNCVPPEHVLQPISSIYTNFNNKRSQRLMEADQDAWWETLGKLQKIIRKAVHVLFITKKFDREHMHNYFMSVTEREVVNGILNAENVEEHCFAYVRDIANINHSLFRFARQFVDFAARSVDGEAQSLLKTLRDEKLPQKLPESNIARFTVEWGGKEGIDKDTHAEYLKTFTTHFHKTIIWLVESALAKHEKLSSDAVYSETLQHLHSCRRYCEIFQGREETIEKIHKYIVGDNNSPLILYGESGCGKTSLLAKGASQVATWLEETPVNMVIRFLGTTPHSSNIIAVLTSLCRQLSNLYDQPTGDIPEELSPLILHLKKLLACATIDRPLMLFLDSLDQLSGTDGAHQLAWLPTALPPNCKLVVSVIPNMHNLLNTLKTMIEGEENYVQILPLGQNLGGTIIRSWLEKGKRTISEEQWTVVNEAIAKCNLPLFVKLVFDEVFRWRSYMPIRTTTLAYTIHDIIVKLFEKIEVQHGRLLVAHALGYITASKSGLSEMELEDLLSLDEKVLNDVYQYHLPPVRRIPPLIWTRIRNDLPGYLSEREADGVNVINWYHRQFIEAAKERYFRNLNFVSETHSNAAEYFLGTWGGGNPKPFEYSELQRQRFRIVDTQSQSDRKVPAQPLIFKDSKGTVMRFNLRKLSEMPYHFTRSHRYEDLYDKVLFNYSWLHAKLSAMPLQSVLSDYEDLLDHVFDKDVKLIADALRLSSSVLSHNPSMVGPQLIGRLLPYYGQNPRVRGLIDQCDSDGIHNCALVPTHHCLHSPGGPLQYSLEGHPFAPYGIGYTHDGRYLVSVSNKFIIWDLTTGDIFRTVDPKIEGIMQNLYVSENSKFAAGYTNNNQVIVCSVLTGEFWVITPELSSKTATLIGATVSNSQTVTWTETEWFLYTNQGKFINKHQNELKMPFVYVDFGSDDDIYQVVKSGADNDSDLALEVYNKKIEPFEFHSAFVMTKDRQTVYACIEISDNAVACYQRKETGWTYDRTLADNIDTLYAMALSYDNHYLIATTALGYKLWDLKSNQLRFLKLPHGIRNIPTKNALTSAVTFTKKNHFVVAGVRNNIYVWDVKQGNMVKVLDAHFGRIVSLIAVISGSNKVISSSMDKTIKVWNFDNILEEVHSIDRLQRGIEQIDLTDSDICIAATRTLVTLWNTENGKLLKTIPNLSPSALVAHSLITKDGKRVVIAESGKVVVWDIENLEKIDKPVHVIPCGDVQQLILNEEDTKVIAVSKGASGMGLCGCFSIADAEEIYKREFKIKRFRRAVLTKEGLFLVIPACDKSGDIIAVYHAKTGAHLYNLQLKYNNYQELTHLVAMPDDPNRIAVIDNDKGNILDLKKKSLVRSVPKWNGMASSDGKTGLYAPSRGGLLMLDLKNGKTVNTLIPRIAEGVFNINVMYTKNDQHVVYYHSGHRTIRVFRVSDGKLIANFKAGAEVNTMAGTKDGNAIMVGAVDGSMTVLAVTDPELEVNKEFLKKCRFKLIHGPGGINGHAANGTIPIDKHAMGAALHVARFVAKARVAQKSRACVIS